MITEIKGYVKVSRKAFTKVTALIVALAIMCAVTAFAASPSFYVDIYDGNEITRVLTSKSDPKTIVSQAGVKLDDRDKLDSTGFTAGEDSALRIYRSATVSFTDIEGNTIYTVFAGTVQDLLEELDVTLSDGQLITYPLDTVLKDGMDVRVTNSYDVSVTADGTTNSFTMGEGTVRDALNRIGVTLGDDDEVSPELDAMVCDLIGAFLDDLAAGENPGVVVAIEDAASNRYLAALDEDGEEACLEAATNFISEHKMGLKDEGLGRIVRYAIGYTGCVEIDGGYHDALLVSFFETTLESGFSAYVLYEGMGAGDGFMWSDPEPAGEETPLI